MSDLESALGAVRCVKGTFTEFLGQLTPPPPQQHFRSLDNWYHSVSKKLQSIELANTLVASPEWERFAEISQRFQDGRGALEIEEGALRISLSAVDAETFLLLLVEHLASCAKNVTDVYAVFLNQVWQLGLQTHLANIERIAGKVRGRNQGHPVLVVANGLWPPESWYSAAGRIRNECQHRDSTSIMSRKVGRNAVPYIEEDLLPGKGETDRSISNFCPWLADQVYQFIEQIGSALTTSPAL